MNATTSLFVSPIIVRPRAANLLKAVAMLLALTTVCLCPFLVPPDPVFRVLSLLIALFCGTYLVLGLYGVWRGPHVVIEPTGLTLPGLEKNPTHLEWRWIKGFSAVTFENQEYTGIRLNDPRPVFALYPDGAAAEIAASFAANRQRVGVDLVIEACYRDRDAKAFAKYLEGFREMYTEDKHA